MHCVINYLKTYDDFFGNLLNLSVLLRGELSRFGKLWWSKAIFETLQILKNRTLVIEIEPRFKYALEYRYYVRVYLRLYHCAYDCAFVCLFVCVIVCMCVCVSLFVILYVSIKKIKKNQLCKFACLFLYVNVCALCIWEYGRNLYLLSVFVFVLLNSICWICVCHFVYVF